MDATRRNPDLVGDALSMAMMVGFGLVGLHVLKTALPDVFASVPDPTTGLQQASDAISTALTTVQQRIDGTFGPSSGNQATTPAISGMPSNGVTKGGTGGQPTCPGVDVRNWPDAAALVKLASQWRLARSANGQDPDDWNAFVLHVKALTVPGVGMSNYFPQWLSCPWVGWPDAWYFGGVLGYGTIGIPFASNPGG